MSGQPLILSIIHGVEGNSVCLGDAPGSGTRIAGPKPWGGGKVKQSWTVDRVALGRVLAGEPAAAEPAERGEPAVAPFVEYADPETGEPLYRPAQPPASGEAPEREAPKDCRHEPAYPGSRTVVCSLSDPDMVAHESTDRCSTETPHLIAECGEFAPEPPADWREAVKGACEALPEYIGACPVRGPEPVAMVPKPDIYPAVLSALAPLVLAERMRAERLRRNLRRVLSAADKDVKIARRPSDPEDGWECPQCGSGQECAPGCTRNALLGALDDAETALAADPLGDPAAIGTECPGCGEWHRDGHRDSCACNHCLPAGEEAGDG